MGESPLVLAQGSRALIPGLVNCEWTRGGTVPLQCPPLVPPYYYCWAWRLGGRGVKALLLGPREFDRTLIDLVADGQAPLTCRENLVSAARQG